MTSTERKTRLMVAHEIISSVHNDMCHDRDGDISKEQLLDLCDILNSVLRFSEALNEKKEAPIDDKA